MNDLDYVELSYQATINKLENELSKLRKEIHHLEVAIHDGDMVIAELKKDEARLDWLLSDNMSGDHIVCIIDFEGQWVNTREHIDKAMEEKQ